MLQVTKKAENGDLEYKYVCEHCHAMTSKQVRGPEERSSSSSSATDAGAPEPKSKGMRAGQPRDLTVTVERLLEEMKVKEDGME